VCPKKKCVGTSYGTHWYATRTKSQRYALKKNGNCGVVYCASVFQGDNGAPIGILEEKNKTTNIFFVHWCFRFSFI
jgi:hypothetical protein